MTKQEIVDKVKGLGLPDGSYIVFGSCPLAAAGLREAGDIDMLVSKQLLGELQRRGWKLVDKGEDDKPLAWDVFEAHDNWNFGGYNPALQQLMDTADVIDGIPFASLQEVRKWKAASGRPKDLKDIELIDRHLARQKELDELVKAWTAYTSTVKDWKNLVKGVTPKSTDCGPVYELPNPIERPNESFAVCDMRDLQYTGPHYHANGEVEVYIVLAGSGRLFVGGQERPLNPGSVIVIPPDTAHFTIPAEDLVLALINTPPFNPANAVSVTQTNMAVSFDKTQFEQAKQLL